MVLLYFQRHKYLYLSLLFTLLFAIFSAFMISHIDLLNFDYFWVKWMSENGLFNIYHVEDDIISSGINYPPLYPMFLYFIRNFVTTPHSYATQFFLKLFPVVLFMISQIWIYFKVSEKVLLKWTFCLPFIVNALLWGQRDIAFIFFMILMFYYIEHDKVYNVTLWFTLACLLKLQGVLLLPIFLVYLFISKEKRKHKVLAFCSGVGLGVITYLPFMIAEKSIMAFFNLYFHCDHNNSRFNAMAPNIWCLLSGDLNFTSNLVSMFNIIISVLVIILFLFIYHKTKDIITASTLYLFSYFVFNVGQTERYSLYLFGCLFFMIYVSINRFEYLKKYSNMQFIYKHCYMICFIVPFSVWLFTNIKPWMYMAFGYYEEYGCLTIFSVIDDTKVVSKISQVLSSNMLFMNLSNITSYSCWFIVIVCAIFMIRAYYKFFNDVYFNIYKPEQNTLQK